MSKLAVNHSKWYKATVCIKQSSLGRQIKTTYPCPCFFSLLFLCLSSLIHSFSPFSSLSLLCPLTLKIKNRLLLKSQDINKPTGYSWFFTLRLCHSRCISSSAYTRYTRYASHFPESDGAPPQQQYLLLSFESISISSLVPVFRVKQYHQQALHTYLTMGKYKLKMHKLLMAVLTINK